MLKWKNLLLLVVVVALVGGALIFYRYYFSRYNNTVNKPSITTVTPTPTNTKLTIKDCNIKKEGNPLISNLWNIEKSNLVAGTLVGNIQKVTTSNSSATLKIISPKGDQTYEFTVPVEKGMFFSNTSQKEVSVTFLHSGQSALVSFSCFPKQNNLFKITQVAVAEK